MRSLASRAWIFALGFSVMVPGAAHCAALAGATAVSAPPSLPAVEFEAPTELAVVAESLSRRGPERLAEIVRLVGLETPGPPIRVILALDRSEAAAAVPGWVAGYAYSALGVVVLLTDRSPSYPDSTLAEVLDHEIAHVLIARAAGHEAVPRWFNEGVAMIAGNSWGIDDRSLVTLALLVESRVPLDELDERFAGDHSEIRRAYALSGAFVRDLLRRRGPGAVREILQRVSSGLPFAEAFRRSTGLTLAQAEGSFWRRHALWYRWIPILTSSATLWIGITLLALWAIKRRRARDAAQMARWDEEEHLLEAALLPDETIH